MRSWNICFIEQAQDSFKQPITELELKQAINDMAMMKSPRLDGCIVEFYSRILALSLLRWYTHAQTNGRFSIRMNYGFIYLLHKGGFKEELSNWPPITLLNKYY